MRIEIEVKDSATLSRIGELDKQLRTTFQDVIKETDWKWEK